MKILFLVPYPFGTAASQRFRVEQYLECLRQAGIEYTLRPFMSRWTWAVLYRRGSAILKLAGVVAGFFRRFGDIPAAWSSDIVFIHREASPLGPPIFEWLIAKALRKKIVFDFDDAIWLPNTSGENRIAARLKGHSKTGRICKWSYRISAGNAFIAGYARRFNPNVVINPTVVDAGRYYNRLKAHAAGPPVIGWTGSHSTLKYIRLILPALQRLEKTHDFTFLVIADKNPELPLRRYRYAPWNKQTEIDDLLQTDIGVMPLTDDPWSKGKCGFKLLQYMALGIPAVASPVGVNASIIDPPRNGYLCATEEEWLQKLTALIENPDLRREMGLNGRTKAEQHYSLKSNTANFLGLFT